MAVLEAAFITPVFFLLVMGIFEGGMYMKDDLALASSVRAGARAASAVGNEERADVYTLVGLSREASAISHGDIVRVVIYRPATFGEEPPDGCKNGSSIDGVCNVYTMANIDQALAQVAEETRARAAGENPSPSLMVFGCKTSSPDRFWCPTRRKVTQPDGGPDYVGVWMRVEHRWITKMFGNKSTLDDQSVIRLEPRSS